MTADQTGRPGTYVPLAKTIIDVEAIITGKMDNVKDEQLLYIGDLSAISNAART